MNTKKVENFNLELILMIMKKSAQELEHREFQQSQEGLNH